MLHKQETPVGGGQRGLLTPAGQLGQQEAAMATCPGYWGSTALSSLTSSSFPPSCALCSSYMGSLFLQHARHAPDSGSLHVL